MTWDASGAETQVATGVSLESLVVSRSGELHATDTGSSRLLQWSAKGVLTATRAGIARPSGLTLVPDQTLLVVADAASPFASSFQLAPQGPGFEQPFFHLHLAEGAVSSGVSSLAVDANGYLYAASPIGVQVCDQAGRVNGIVSLPVAGSPSGIAFGGEGRDELFVAVGGRVFRRKTRARGVFSPSKRR